MQFLLTITITSESMATLTGRFRNTIYIPELQQHVVTPFWYSENQMSINGEKYFVKLEKFIAVKDGDGK